MGTICETSTDLLVDVVTFMSNQMGNVRVVMYYHRLINRYSSEQLGELETPLKRSLTEVLLAAVKLHCADSLVVENVCNLLVKIGIDRDNIDLYLEAIDSLVEIIYGENNLALMARRTSLDLLTLIIRTADRTDASLMAEKPFMETICQSIAHRLLKSDFDKRMVFSWKCLCGICCDSLSNLRRFLDCDGLSLLQRCYEKFGNQVTLVSEMMSMMLELSFEETCRQDMMSGGTLQLAWQMWRESDDDDDYLSYSWIFCNFLVDSSINWQLGLLRVEVETKVTLLMVELIESDGNLKANGEIEMILDILWEKWAETNDPQISSFCSRIFSICLSIEQTDWPVSKPTKYEIEEKLAVEQVVKLLIEDVIDICAHIQ